MGGKVPFFTIETMGNVDFGHGTQKLEILHHATIEIIHI
jgi:hypothetical protein